MMTLENRLSTSLHEKVDSYFEDSAGLDRGVRVDARTGQFTSYKLTFSHELIESLLLVNLAVDFGAVSRPNAQALYSSVFRPFFASLARRSNDISQGGEYVEPSAESEHLLQSFGRFTNTIEQGIRGGELGVEALKVNDARGLRQRIEKIILIHLRMITDPGIFVYLDATRYWTEGAWDHVFENIPLPEEVVQAAEDGTQRSSTVLYGFLRLVGFQSEIKDTLDDMEGIQDESDAIRFREWVRNIFNWRLDFRSQRSMMRFEQIRDLLITVSAAELPVGDRALVREKLKNIFDEVYGLNLVSA